MSRIAIYADLHGNVPALRAFEADVRKRGVDSLWCLGDVVGKGPDSDVTCDWARENSEFILRGNWDSGIGFKEFPADHYYWNQLGEERMTFLQSLPLEKYVTVSGRRIRLFHGRPLMKPLLFIQNSAEEFEPYFRGGTDVLIWADAHRAGMRLAGQGMQVVNCGSVGNGLGMNQVQYCIMEGDLDGTEKTPIAFTFITLDYDHESAALRALETDLPHKENYAEEVRTGRYCRY
ncbi:MAG: metallophosphatase family protein [Clostridiales bacterium]|nr:metallophosphatase family protein [Clostridiales bacterium]